MDGFLTVLYIRIYSSSLPKAWKSFLLQIVLSLKTIQNPKGSEFPDPLELYRLEEDRKEKS